MGMESVFKLSVILGMIDNLSGGMSGAEGNVSESVKKLNGSFESIGKIGGVMAGIGGGITAASLATVTSTFETQDALGELKSLGVTDLKAVEEAARNFSNTWAGTTKADFISAAYDIKSGIASLTDEGVAEFTSLAGLTATATKSTTGEMTSLFATGYGIYKNYYSELSDMEFGEMFSAGIATAVKNYKTSGSQMAASIGMLGATATNANISMEEQLAILGQLQTTMSGSEAATKYKAFLNTAASAGEKLGLTFIDSNNQLLSMPEILNKLKSKYGETLDAVEKQKLKEAFGTDEAIAMIDLLYGNVDTLQTGIEDLAVSMAGGTAVTEQMAEAINNTPAKKFELLKQQIHTNVEELGNNLLPVVNESIDKVSRLVSKGSDWISKNKETIGTVMNLALKIGVLMTAIGGGLVIFGKLGTALLSINKGIHVLKTAFSLLNVSMLASPVTWIILGIVGLTAAFVMLWQKSEAFRSFWMTMFNQVKQIFASAWSNIQPALGSLGEKFQELYIALQPVLKVLGQIIGGMLLTMVGEVMGVIQGLANAAVPLIDAFGELVSFVTDVVNMITALFHGDFSAAFNFAESAMDHAKNFFINVFEAIGSFAEGFVSGFLDTIGTAFSLLGFDISDKLAAMKADVKEKITAVKEVMGAVTSAATETVKQNLNHMKSAYEANGGGIKGIAAAAMEGVKSFYTSGLAFIDNLTGGKLSTIKNQWVNGFNNIKTYIAGLPAQFRESGRKIMDTFAAGIRAAVNKPVEAVKSGLQKIRNMLPFSDAKTGPLSKLTLSGSKVMSTFAEGMNQTKELPGQITEKSLGQATYWLSNEESIADRLGSKKTKTLNAKQEGHEYAFAGSGKRDGEQGKGDTIIQKLEITVDISKLKDLPLLYKLIDDIKDAQNGRSETVNA